MVYDKSPVALVGVFAEGSADRLRRRLATVDVRPEQIHLGDEVDRRASLRAEQNEETRRALTSPQAAVVLPKETSKALGISVPVASVVGALIALPFALIEVPGLALGARLFWYAIAGAAAAGTIAFIVTAAMAAKDPFDPGAAQRGLVVRVDSASDAVRQALLELEPIRLDLLDEDGAVLGTVETEEDRDDDGIIEEVEANVERERQADPTERHR